MFGREKKKKVSWYQREINRRIDKINSLSDEEFCNLYKKEMIKGISITNAGILLVIGCIVALFLL
jgi:hypothetical protein